MTTTSPPPAATHLGHRLAAPEASARLQAALAAGTHPDPDFIDVLVDRSGSEPDFFVRDMLTWALTRHPSTLAVPRLLAELGSEVTQARSQALHTLSKIGEPAAWPAITTELLRDPDDEVARAAWRAAVVLVPEGATDDLATELATQLGRGGRDAQLSLSRALAALGAAARTPLARAADTGDESVRIHAIATERLLDDPETGFEAALYEARRLVALAGSPVGGGSDADR